MDKKDFNINYEISFFFFFLNKCLLVKYLLIRFIIIFNIISSPLKYLFDNHMAREIPAVNKNK